MSLGEIGFLNESCLIQSQSIINEILPMRFGSLLTINKIDWQHFKGKADDTLKWSAHVFWNIDFKIIKFGKKPIVNLNVQLLERSWAKQHRKCDHLLNHEQGHLLIAYICGLEFLRRIHTHPNQTKDQQHYQEYVNSVFQRTLKEYVEIQKKYDEETQHRLNFKKQIEWDNYIKEKLIYYHKIFDQKKNRFSALKHKI